MRKIEYVRNTGYTGVGGTRMGRTWGYTGVGGTWVCEKHGWVRNVCEEHEEHGGWTLKAEWTQARKKSNIVWRVVVTPVIIKFLELL